ncbi:MAG: hypothetical protein L3J75_12600 [Methylococcaceae bacterium]|nr:hypothetical protein [Methylococcaceae bacterium]
MKISKYDPGQRGRQFVLFSMLCGLLLVSPVHAANFKLKVLDAETRLPITSGFKWLLQKDETFSVQPNKADPYQLNFGSEPLMTNFHKSYMPLATYTFGAKIGQAIQGHITAANSGSSTLFNIPGNANINKRYYLSVLPDSGYTMSGRQVLIDESGAQTEVVEVLVHKHAIPTAQIRVMVFHDNAPTNGAPDLPAEKPIMPDLRDPLNKLLFDPTKFSVRLFDAAGQYGAAGGEISQDAFGNPLGTTYQKDPATNKPILNAQGDPIVDILAPLGFVIHPGPDGSINIKNLAPAKYGVHVIPPVERRGEQWIQTSTIEGTKTIDAWVGANEPQYFVEFGPPGPHVFVGFIREFNCFVPRSRNYKTSCQSPREDANGDLIRVDLADPNSAVARFDNFPGLVGGGATIRGLVTDQHMSRPPDFTMYSGRDFPDCRIVLNKGGLGGQAIYSKACRNSTFTIGRVPAGTYTLTIYDTNLDAVIASQALTVTETLNTAGNPVFTCSTLDESCDLGEVGVFNWFHRLETTTFYDADEDGVFDPNEQNLGADQSAVNLRFRDGRLYQAAAIDGFGEAPFAEVFPFFHWLVVETDFAKLKATGATFYVDGGGALEFDASTNPQTQSTTVNGIALPDCNADLLAEECTADGGLSRTQRGPVLTQAFQGFLGQTNKIEFGKTFYDVQAGENGGISGIVHYAITRAENDPRYAVGEQWEPGIPRVQVNLYPDVNNDGVIDTNGLFIPADVDNYPLGWGDPACVNSAAIPGNECAKGSEDIDHNGNAAFDLGDALEVTWTDSWDDSIPVECQGQNKLTQPIGLNNLVVNDNDCFDGLRNFNQLRPGVFDGGYAFGPELDCPLAGCGAHLTPAATANKGYLKTGTYIVAAITPPGYNTVKEEDKNVDFGDQYEPGTLLLPAECVGDMHAVPQFLVYDNATPTPNWTAGLQTPMCDRKKMRLSGGQNATTNFFMFTDVPVAAQAVGGILNDLGNEFDPNNPNFGEKFAPSFVPVGFYNFDGTEVNRIYTDEFGKFNALLPSTTTINVPMPSGVSPNMLTACMNDAGFVDNPNFDPANPTAAPAKIVDPLHNPVFSQFCYTFQYMAGGTTYLDTPVLPVSAFAGPSNFPVDCSAATSTPLIHQVTNGNNEGPYINLASPIANKTLIISAQGPTLVPNPDFDGTTNLRQITRDYNFGVNPGIVTLGGTAIPAANVAWGSGSITVTVPANTPAGPQQLLVTDANGNETPVGVTVFIEKDVLNPTPVHFVTGPTQSIQDAIDIASPGDLILIGPGLYDELLIMDRPVQLQGWGAEATIINARKVPATKLDNWRLLIAQKFNAGLFDMLAPQVAAVAGGAGQLFPAEEGAALTVVAKQFGVRRFCDVSLTPNCSYPTPARIDGLGFTGADHGGGIFVNAFARSLQISNNKVYGNQGTFGGGIRLGNNDLINTNGAVVALDSGNIDVNIHHNIIKQNGNFGGAGGGLSLYTGSTRYQVTDNFICGNYASTDGGGIGHLGLSSGSRIERNDIVFNQNFKQTPGSNVKGGGILVAGAVPAPGQILTAGSGSVTINANRIQGNNAAAGEGAGIALHNVNGTDLLCTQRNVNAAQAGCTTVGETRKSGSWWFIEIYNNIIANNVAALSGGGISLQDAVHVAIDNNTIVYNDSTGTSGLAFTPGNPNQSNPKTAGVVTNTNVHLGSCANNGPICTTGTVLAGYPKQAGFSNPLLRNNIIWHNRSFNFEVNPLFDPNVAISGSNEPFGLCPNLAAASSRACQNSGTGIGGAKAANYDDLTVTLDPRFSLLTDIVLNTGAGFKASNRYYEGTSFMVNDVVNGAQGQTIQQGEATTSIAVAAAFDEGGNFIDISYGKLSLGLSDFHIKPVIATAIVNHPVIDKGVDFNIQPRNIELATDFDGDLRPQGVKTDIGADEAQ